MRFGFTFLCIFLLILSCAEKVIEPPKNLISEEKMAIILYDLAILNSTKGTTPGTLKSNNIKLMPFIYEKHNIDSLQFVQSDVYYASIPLKYQTIYEVVEARLDTEVKVIENEKKRKTDSIKEIGKRRRDSIKAPKKLPISDSLPKR